MNPAGTSSLDGLSEVFDLTEMPARFAAPAPAPLILTARQPGGSRRVDPRVARAVRTALDTRSALLIRGLAVTDPMAVTALGDLIFAGEPAFATGEHPHAQGAEGVYRPVRFAPAETLLWHHENSFNARWPRFIMFACAVPAEEGGETSIVNSRLVYEQMPLNATGPLARHGIRYERLCDGRTSRSWEQIYGTADRDLAHQRAAANGDDLIHTADGARITMLRPAFQAVRHGTSWFNQMLHWHPHALPADLRQMMAGGLVPTYRTCRVGDGTQIPSGTVNMLIEAHRAVEFAIRWRAGDVLLIDNEVVAHGRLPYRGRREHFVRMFAARDSGAASQEIR